MECLKVENISIQIFLKRIIAGQLNTCAYRCCLYMSALLLALNIFVTGSLAQDTEYVIETPSGFVKRNMATSKAKLKELKKIYLERFGNLPDTESDRFASGVFNTVKALEMVDLTWVVTTPGDWGSYIDKDHLTTYRRWECTKKDQNGDCIYKRVRVEMRTAATLYAPKNPYNGNMRTYVKLDFPLGKPVRNYVVAADEITAKLLHMPQKAGLKLITYGYAVDVNPNRNRPCCKTYSKKVNESGKCLTRYPFNSIKRTVIVDPRRDPRIARKFGFSLLSGKASFTDNNAAIQFYRPGSQNIYLVFKNSGPAIASENICGKDRWGKDIKQVAKYKSSGILKIPVKARAISLEGIKLDNSVEVSFKKINIDLPQLDLFFRHPGSVRSLPFKVTGVSVKWGDAPERIEKRIIEGEIKSRLKIEWKPKKPGPFIMDHKGRIKDVVGIGEGYRELSIGKGMFNFTQKLTANRFRMIMPEGLLDGDGKPGKEYPLILKVHGPADLNKFIVEWSGFDKGAWKEKTTGFEKVKDDWISRNSFIMPLKKNKESKDTSADRKYIRIRVMNPRYEGKLAFSYSHLIRRTGPVIKGIKLFVSRPGQTPEPDQSIDLFYPNFLTRDTVLLIPKAVLADGSVRELDKVGKDAHATRVLLKTDAPEIIELKGLRAAAKFSMGEATVTATIGGLVLDPNDNLELGKKALVSDPLRIWVNQLRLSRLLPAVRGGPERYILRVIGPSDMSKNYKVSWIGKNQQSGNFESSEDGTFMAEYTGDGLEKIKIQKKGVPVAMLFASSAGQQALIQIYPITPPITMVEHKAVGDLETSTECRKRLMMDAGFIAKVRGGNLRNAAKDACKKTRFSDKKTSKLTKKLNKKGQQLITIGNSVTITARAVYAPADAQCAWTIKDGGGLSLGKKITPLTDKGFCTNTLYGFKNGYNLDAKVLVELRHVMVPKAMGAPMVTNGNGPVKVSSFKYEVRNFNQ